MAILSPTAFVLIHAFVNVWFSLWCFRYGVSDVFSGFSRVLLTLLCMNILFGVPMLSVPLLSCLATHWSPTHTWFGVVTTFSVSMLSRQIYLVFYVIRPIVVIHVDIFF